ncbi:thiamine ABC transporter substrate binding subunit [Oceanicola sp. 502str15]|uniref:thiamine ABC transporter substrate-binding protein n=1 Tax=Oceanicola sp. 502str15 TaxID=2696061 RepID=UPI0020957C0C|nr:thiamine ABC transporter substrate binding subunit [Oceanicola sp. 502str15]MCO6384297.1 thiamine ABC transporter substrate-binding protein [Oceanicola sp. 502str15]
MKAPLIAAGFALVASTAAAETLTVYAPDYFASEWGPGPAIQAAYEAECGCELEFVTGDVLPRILLEGERSEADVAIGLSQDEIARAGASGLFAPHGQDVSSLTMPVSWEDDTFLPFDWSHLAFIYDERTENPPTSFEALLALPDDTRIVIQDPRASAAGLALVMWVEALYGDKAGEAWERLAPKILTVTKGWSEAYGLFTEGEADMVLSYTTSPAYHIMAEGDESKKAAIFEEGNYLYVELAAKLASSDQPELAQGFMDFILSDGFQQAIPEGNWSFPAKLDPEKLPEVFRNLPVPATAVYVSAEEAEALKADAIETWRQGLSQ